MVLTLEKPDEWEVRLHCDEVALSIQKSDRGWPYKKIIQRYPEATAVEMEGGGRNFSPLLDRCSFTNVICPFV